MLERRNHFQCVNLCYLHIIEKAGKLTSWSQPAVATTSNRFHLLVVFVSMAEQQPVALKARRGSGFYEIFCIFANMSCLCIHLVTLFNLPGKKKLSWIFFFYVVKYRFSVIPKCLFR